MSHLDSFPTACKTHIFGAELTIDTNFLGNSSDFTALKTSEFDRLYMVVHFPTAPATGDTDIVTLELASASSNNDSDFANVDTDGFSNGFSPAASSAAAYGTIEADIDLKKAGASIWVRPSLSVAGTGVSVANVVAIGILYNGTGIRDHEVADSDGPVTNY